MSEARPPLGGLHEAGVYVEDLDRAERFWTELGFELAGRARGRHVFFRAGRDMLLLFRAEATLAPGGGVPAHGAKGPGHIAFDVPDRDALEAWRRRLEALDVAVEYEQEWPAGGRSIYFRDPDGNSIEFITRGSWGG